MDQGRDQWRQAIVNLLTLIAQGSGGGGGNIMSQSFTITPSASQNVAPAVNSDDIVNDFAQGLTITLTTGAAVGGAKAFLKVQRKDEVSGSYIDIPGAVTIQLGPNAFTDLTIKPGVNPTNNRRISDVSPRIFRTVLTVAGGTSIVVGISGEFN